MPRMTRYERDKIKDRKKALDRYYYYKEKGICPACGTQDAQLGHVLCKACMERKKEQELQRDPAHEKRKQYFRNKYQERVAKGLCTQCGRPTNNKHKQCDRCLAEGRMRYHLWKIKKKLAAEKNRRGERR